MLRKNWQVEILSKLGEGAYGCVYKAKFKETGQIVALKTIKMSSEDQGVSSTTLREASILQSLNHPNIIKMLAWRIDHESFDPKVELLFEFMEEDLSKKIRRQNALHESTVKNILKQILTGVDYLHEMCVFHRDLKPQNILITNEKVKIADFGLGRIVSKNWQTMSKEIQTLWYRAPQLLLGSVNYDFSVDVWSVGCIFFQLAEGSVLFQTQSQIGQILEIMKQLGTPHLSQWKELENLPNFKGTFPKFIKTPRIYNRLSPSGIDLLQKMTKLNPKERITIKDALNHEYFRDTQAQI